MRHLKDFPLEQRAVRIELTVRRFRCLNTKCSRSTFVEPITELAVSYAQSTTRFTAAARAIGLALGGEAGTRLAHELGLPLSADTLLRIIRATALEPDAQSARVLGLDDWAWKRGCVYGTLLVDLEHKRPVELLSERTAESLAAWLTEHPAVRIIARDRFGEYLRGIQLGAPRVTQVADRWHLLTNLREALERSLAALKAALQQLPLNRADESAPRVRRRAWFSALAEAERLAKRQQRLERFQQVRALHQHGMKLLRIAKTLGLNRKTVRKFVKADAYPEIAPHVVRTQLTPYEPYLWRRWRQGCRNAVQLRRELMPQGFRGSRRQLAKWLTVRREQPYRYSDIATQSHDPSSPASNPTPPSPKRTIELPSAKRLSWLLVKAPKALDEQDTFLLQHILQHPTVQQGYELAQQFVTMVRQRLHQNFRSWLRACERSRVSDLVSFAAGLRSDFRAVHAALKLPWSNGQLEGQINRLKLIKRQMYGRANFDLLRIRVLAPS